MFLFCAENKGKLDVTDLAVTGFLSAVFMAGVIALPFINWRLPFHIYRNLMFTVLFSGFVLMFAVYAKQLKIIKKPAFSLWQPCLAAVFLLLIFSFWIYLPDTVNDVGLETVRTTLATDMVYEYNPVTGRKLELGMYPVSKLYVLPIFYSAWASVLPVDAGAFLYYIAPSAVLLLHFLVIYKWVRLSAKPEHTGMLMCFYGLALLFGDYHASTLSYRLLHQGWMGQTVLMAVCVPYLGYQCIRMWREGAGPSRLLSALLCLAAGLFLFPFKAVRPFGEMLRLIARGNLYGKYTGLWLIGILILVLMMKKEDRKFLVLIPLVPIPLVITYCAYVLCLRIEKGKKRRTAVLALVALTALSGSVLPYKTDLVKKKYLSRDAITALEAADDLAAGASEGPVLLAPDEVIKQARAHSSRLYPLYGKDLWNKNANSAVADDYPPETYQLYELMKEDYRNQDEIARLALEYGCDILILRERITREAKDAYLSWEIYREVPGYLVYRRRDMIE